MFGLAYLYQQRQPSTERSSKRSEGGDSLDGLALDLTARAERGELDPFSGRDDEIERTVHILLRRTKNNPLIIGEPGVGKTAIVEGLAQRIADGNIPEGLKGRRILSLDVTSLVSETKFRGELESRLKRLTQDLEAMGRSVILFIDEVHQLQQIGKAEGSLNITDVLKPALARGDLQVIGATTWSEYEEYMRPDQALDRRFQPVLVDEPNQEQALAMLQNLRATYEAFHKVRITDAALEAAVRLSDEKIARRYLPDKAIDLIDEAAAKVAIEAHAHHAVPLGVVHAASHGDKETVGVNDIQEVVDQWIIHSKEEARRDARKEDLTKKHPLTELGVLLCYRLAAAFTKALNSG